MSVPARITYQDYLKLPGEQRCRSTGSFDPQEQTVEVACLRDGALETVNTAQVGANVRSSLFPELVLPVRNLFEQG